MNAFLTLDEAVRASFPTGSTRVVAVSGHGDCAVALFDTRPTGEPYLYEVHYERRNGRWSEGGSSNGSGWYRLEGGSARGVVTLWADDAPPGADSVRAELAGEVLEVPVERGIYFLVWWDVPEDLAAAREFRVSGEWVDAPTVRERLLARRRRENP